MLTAQWRKGLALLSLSMPIIGQEIVWQIRPLAPGLQQGELTIFTREPHQIWQKKRRIPVVLGKKGIAISAIEIPGLWSINKHEGDGKTPSGTYHIHSLFAQDLISPGPQWQYHRITPTSRWNDRPWHPGYNQWHDQIPLGEQMTRPDHLYQKGIVLDYNQHPTLAFRGSAIFIHQWRNATTPTAGCIAMSHHNLNQLWHDLSTIKPKKLTIQIQP